MDDFDYSVQISEHDWDAFFQECEECDLLPPTLAGLEDSGMSDADDVRSSRSSKDPHVAKEMEFSESEISDNEPPECTGWPVERYLCACDRPDPECILSCSEEDTHLESVNMFFERLKDIADGGQLPGESTPEEERLGDGCAKDPTVLMHFPQGESQTNSQETMSVKTHSTEMGETDVIRARKSAETESDNEVSKSPKPTEEFNEERKKEKGCYPSKNKCEPLHSLSSNDEFRCSNKLREENMHCSGQGASPGRITGAKFQGSLLPQMELQTNPEALHCLGTNASAEQLNVRSPKKKEKEQWFVSLEAGQNHSTERISPSVRKKRKRIGSSRDSVVLGQAFEGTRSGSDSEIQMGRCEQVAAGQGEVPLKPDSTAYTAGAGAKCDGLSKRQMNNSSEIFTTNSRSVPEVPTVQESGAGSPTADTDNGFKEFVSDTFTRHERYDRSKCQKEINPSSQHECESGYSQNYSQKNYIPANEKEIYNLPTCEKGKDNHENLQSVGVKTSPTLPQHTELPPPETRHASEVIFSNESDQLNISEKSISDQKTLENEHTLQIDSQGHSTAVYRLSKASFEVVSPPKSQQYDEPFVNDNSGSEESKRQNLQENGHKVTHGNNLLTFSQEQSQNDTRSPDASPPKEFYLEMVNAVEPPEHTEPSLSLNDMSAYGPSWGKTADPVDVRCPKPEDERPSEFQKVENVHGVPMSTPDVDTSHWCLVETDDSLTDNIALKTNAVSENGQSLAVTNDKSLVLEEPQMNYEQNTLVRSDLAPSTLHPDSYKHAVGLPSNSVESSVQGDVIGVCNLKSSALPDSDSDKGIQTEENLSHSSSKECSKATLTNSLHTSTDVSAEDKVDHEPQNSSPVDTPPSLTSQLKGDSGAECETSRLLEVKTSAPSLESVDLTKALVPISPVHTMSSFWKEMEKLTINDILCLRPRGLQYPQAGALMAISDADDSGYSSHPEDSRPDRSSGDMSTISDFEEECSLDQNASANSSLEPQGKKQVLSSPGSRGPEGISWESVPDPVIAGMDSSTNDMPILYSRDTISPLPLSGKAQQVPRRMCKTISVKNLRALEAETHKKQIISATLKGDELNNCRSMFQKTNENQNTFPVETGDNVVTSTSSSHSENELMESQGITFREIFQYFFGPSKAEVDPEHTACTEVLADHGRSVPEMYDHFFSEFETGNFFLPLILESRTGEDEPVPVFSCSRSSNRNLQFPEAYDYFFPDDSPVASEDDEDSDQEPIRVVTRYNKGFHEPLGAAATPDAYEHFFTEDDWSESLFWRNPLSLRGLRFTGQTSPKAAPTSCVLVTAEQQGTSLLSTIYTDSVLHCHGTVSPQAPLYCLEEQIFKELAERPRKYAELPNVIAVPKSPIVTLKQSDMCLICIAFASWVLRTGNPQDADTWKAALLANVSALSAIRYLRRNVKEDPARNEP